MSTRGEAISVKDLSVSFEDNRVLTDINLNLAGGSHIALLGPSGCGKTTLLRTIAGLQHATTGEVRVGSQLVDGPNTFVEPEQRNVGLVFQSGALFNHMNVERNVAFGVRKDPDGAKAAAEALDLVGMSKYSQRMPETLSGGQRQRVALARALAPRPDVLLLDEPFASLDAALRVELRTQVAKLLRDLGITSVLVTHDQDEAFVAGETVAIMSEGEIQQIGPPADVYSNPSNRFVASFLGEANLIEGTVNENAVETPWGMIPLRGSSEQPKGLVEVVVRPEHFFLTDTEESNSATVQSVEFFGHDSLYTVCSNGSPITIRESAAPRFVLGDRVTVEHRGIPSVAYALDVEPDKSTSPKDSPAPDHESLKAAI